MSSVFVKFNCVVGDAENYLTLIRFIKLLNGYVARIWGKIENANQ